MLGKCEKYLEVIGVFWGGSGGERKVKRSESDQTEVGFDWRRTGEDKRFSLYSRVQYSVQDMGQLEQ